MLIEMSDTVLGKNILFLRRKHKLSRKALSCLTGISVYTLKKWEEETCNPVISWEQLKSISVIFDVSAESLIHKKQDVV